MSALLPSDDDDRAAISALLERWDHGWLMGDAQHFAGDYTSDALWVNAFGVVTYGPHEIVAFLQAGFAQGYWQAARFTRSDPEIRFIVPDVTVVHTTTRLRGQRAPNGHELPERRIHELRTLKREPTGWKIAAHMIMDQRDMPT